MLSLILLLLIPFAARSQDAHTIVQDEYGSVVRINVEKIKDWSKVPSVKQCIEIPAEQDQDQTQHGVISNMKDVDGDGLDEIFSSRNGIIDAITPDGKILWQDTTQKNHSDNFAICD